MKAGTPKTVQTDPKQVETDYRFYMQQLVNAWFLWLEKNLPMGVQSQKDAFNENGNINFNQSMETFFDKTLENMPNTIQVFGSRINEHNLNEWWRVTSNALGVSLDGYSPTIRSNLIGWNRDNIGLITKLSRDTQNAIQTEIKNGYWEGLTSKDIKKRILRKSNLKPLPGGGNSSVRRKTQNRAELIAVDQTGKLNSQLTQERQTSAGITGYFWRDSKDGRVRGNPSGLYPDAHPSHYSRRGKKFQWDNPPQGGNPGFAIRCRCTAEADFSEFTDSKVVPVEPTVPKKAPNKPVKRFYTIKERDSIPSFYNRKGGEVSEFVEDYVQNYSLLDQTDKTEILWGNLNTELLIGNTLNPLYQDRLDWVKSLFSSVDETKKPLKVFREASLFTLPEEIISKIQRKESIKGESFTNKIILSTSRNKESTTAVGFLGGEKIQMEIRIPKGKKIISVEEEYRGFPENLSSFEERSEFNIKDPLSRVDSEKEIILPPDISFKVVNYVDNLRNKRLVLEVE